jgi:hypothetical protein
LEVEENAKKKRSKRKFDGRVNKREFKTFEREEAWVYR